MSEKVGQNIIVKYVDESNIEIAPADILTGNVGTRHLQPKQR
ncbi:MucBP domain-containing protein [endosymbiont 'TC1' of Trimyema compressum]